MIRLKISVFLIIFSSLSLAREEIIWLTDNKEDTQFIQTKNSNSIGSDTINLVLSQIENFDLIIKSTSVSRIEKELKSTKNSCVGNRIKNQKRAKLNEFSLPVNIHPLPRLYYLTHSISIPKSLINKDNLTSLSVLMKHNLSKKVVLVEGVSYGKAIDKQVMNIDPKQVTHINVDNRYETSSKLLFEGLVDFTIEYPTQMKRQLQKYNYTNDISSFGFATGTGYIQSHIACSKSEIGKSFISAVNKILKELYTSDKYFAAHIKHLDESSIQEFTKNFEDFIKNNRKIN